jgi:hypothetical protein
MAIERSTTALRYWRSSTGRVKPTVSHRSQSFTTRPSGHVSEFAESSPYDFNDHLKARGYRWSDGAEGGLRIWWIDVDEADLEDELCYLRTEIYPYPEADPLTKILTAFEAATTSSAASLILSFLDPV